MELPAHRIHRLLSGDDALLLVSFVLDCTIVIAIFIGLTPVHVRGPHHPC